MNKKILISVALITIFFINPAIVSGADDINVEIREINKEIQNKKDSIKKIQDKQEAYEKIIIQKQREKANLSNQLTILENRIAKAALDIDSVSVEIEKVNLEIQEVNMQIEEKNRKIDQQKEHLESVLRLMQKQDDKSSLEIIVLNESFTDFVNQVKYLEDVNNQIGEALDSLKKYKEQLESQKNTLKQKNKEFNTLKSDLEGKKVVLSDEQQNKTYILGQTNSSEREYQRLLKLAKQEQEQASAEIAGLEKSVRSKLSQAQGKPLEFNDAGFIWPIRNTVTAFFHDPDYPFNYVFEHPAVDIRAAQGSTIKAAASGYVAKAKNAGMGYSYIMIIHGNGLATVYGHVSRIYVSEDEYVVQGQAIGLSGGLPGTPGAGGLTTGPHLHFEVRLNGIPVNPLEYLP